ncbi:MAG TPA: hypothetical protein VMX17_14105 [Candidatus Glassbacteria bacterium]|nr:hypothetical protein [Candidatus Glassbacteria bacterium]
MQMFAVVAEKSKQLPQLNVGSIVEIEFVLCKTLTDFINDERKGVFVSQKNKTYLVRKSMLTDYWIV